MAPEEVNAQANLIFSLFAFLLQAAELSALALFISIVAAFGGFAILLSGHSGFLLWPHLKSEDKRRGFELFEGPGTLIVATSLLLFCVIYLTVLQNYYLRQEGSSSLLSLVLGTAEEGVRSDAEGWKSLLLPQLSSDFSTLWAIVAAFIVIAVVFVFVPCILLAWAGHRARDHAAQALVQMEDKESRRRHGLDTNKARQRLATMVVWPYHYLSLNALLVVAGLLLAALFWPRLAPFAYGTLLVYSVFAVKGQLGSWLRLDK